MDATNIASIIVAVIATGSAVASQRSSAQASKFNARAEAETEAYNRARAFDIATIERQDKELKDLREENKDLEEQLEILRWRISRIEHGLPPAPYQKGKNPDE